MDMGRGGSVPHSLAIRPSIYHCSFSSFPFLLLFIYFCLLSCMFKPTSRISLQVKEKTPPCEWESTGAWRRKLDVDLKVSGTFDLPAF